jgi:hypothetical protein
MELNCPVDQAFGRSRAKRYVGTNERWEFKLFEGGFGDSEYLSRIGFERDGRGFE